MGLDMTYFDEQERRIPRGGVRTRFAPSPTGYMHVGNLRTALYTWLIARHHQGTFLLRIEDTDQERFVEGAMEVIYRTMAQCGLTHDEGPDKGGPAGPYIQTERREIYRKYAELLVEKGAAYRCFCTRERLNALHEQDPAAKYDGRCRRLSREETEEALSRGMPYVIRQRIPDHGSVTFHDVIYGDITVDCSDLDDQILLKSDGLPTYNFANVVDDHLMGITHVVRGSEYLSSSPKYNLLYDAFGWDVPVYIHCAPVMRDAQNKLSKRHGDPSYEDLIEQGYLTTAVINYVALLGWSPRGDMAEQEVFSLDELAQVFDVGGISKSPAIFDQDKLKHFNALYLRAMTPEEFCRVATPFIRQSVRKESIDPALIAPLLQARLERLTEIPEKVDFFDELPDYDVEFYTNKKSKTDRESALEILEQYLPILEQISAWDHDTLYQSMVSFAQEREIKNAKLMWPVRIAVAGKMVTPGGAVEICLILGREETLGRIRKGIEKLRGG